MGPYDPRILNAVGREFKQGTDYVVVVQSSAEPDGHHMPTCPFTYNDEGKAYPDYEAAFNDMLWMVHDMNEEGGVGLAGNI